MQKKFFFSSIAGASVIITIANLFSKSAGFLREAFIAAYFGLSSDYELYLVAFVIPMTINVSVQYFTQNYFIPSYYKFKNKDVSTGDSFTLKIFTTFILAAAVISILFKLFSYPLFHNFFNITHPDSLEMCQQIFSFALLTIPINAASSVIYSRMVADNKFTSPSYSQLFLNVFIIALIPFFSAKWGVYVLLVGSLLGYSAQLVFLIYRSKLKFVKVFNVTFKQNLGVRSTISFLLVAVVIEFLSQLYTLIDRFFYSELQTGGLAALNYAFTIFQLPLGIISIALTTAIFPSFSSAFSQADFKSINDKLIKAFVVICAIFIPISICFIVSGESIVGLLLQRGEFSRENTIITARVLSVLSLTLFIYALYAVMNKLVYSFMLSRELLIIVITGLVVKIVCNFILVGKYYEIGLAAGTAISYFTVFLLTSAIIAKRLGYQIIFRLIKEIFWYLLIASLSWLISSLIVKNLMFEGTLIYLEDYMFIVIFLIIYTSSLFVLKDRFINLTLIK